MATVSSSREVLINTSEQQLFKRDSHFADTYLAKDSTQVAAKKSVEISGDCDIRIATGQTINGTYHLFWSGPNRFNHIEFVIQSSPYNGASIVIIGENYFGGVSLTNLRAAANGPDSQILVTLENRNGGTDPVTCVAYGPAASLDMRVGTEGWSASGDTYRLQKISENTTGSGSALLGANCPATTLTAPYTWIETVALDGSAVYLPAWK